MIAKKLLSLLPVLLALARLAAIRDVDVIGAEGDLVVGGRIGMPFPA